MKQELYNSVSVALDTLDCIDVSGRNNVLRMRDVFVILEGMKHYISSMPEEVLDEQPE